MSIETSMAAYYAARAQEYERIYEKPERQDDLRQLRAIVERTFAGRRVFELACGTGYWTEIIARVAASVTATDLNEEVLAIARAKPINAPNMTICRADAYALPAFTPRFNTGLAAFWWSHVPRARLRIFLEQFHRIFEPRARVMFIDNCYIPGSSTPVSHRDGAGDTHQQRRLDDGSIHDVVKNFPTEAELRAALEGLADDVQVRFLRYYWILDYEVPPG